MSNAVPTCGQNSKANSRMEAAMLAVARDNARRVPCKHCALPVLPETMARHVAACHDEGER